MSGKGPAIYPLTKRREIPGWYPQCAAWLSSSRRHILEPQFEQTSDFYHPSKHSSEGGFESFHRHLLVGASLETRTGIKCVSFSKGEIFWRTTEAAVSIIDKGRVRDAASHKHFTKVVGHAFPRRNGLQMRWALGGNKPTQSVSHACLKDSPVLAYHWTAARYEFPANATALLHQV